MCWQWVNFYHSRTIDKRVVKLALDETSIACFSGKATGNVFLGRKSGILQHLPKQKRRKCLTLVVTAADDDFVQSQLPCFLVGNHNAFLQKDMKYLRAAVGHRVEVIRFVLCILRSVCFGMFHQAE